MKQRIEKLLREAMKLIGIEDDGLRVVLYPMKRKIASISFKTKTIRLNKTIVQNLDDEALKYILVHELIHYKTKSIQHDTRFWEELRKLYSEKKVFEIENKIINSIYTKFKHPL